MYLHANRTIEIFTTLFYSLSIIHNSNQKRNSLLHMDYKNKKKKVFVKFSSK